jgi:hypothetical protein
VPLERVRGGGWRGASRPSTGSRLDVDGARVSAVTREPGGLTVRVFNASPDRTTVRISHDGGSLASRTVGLDGTLRAEVDGPLHLRPWEIATVRLDG